MKKFMALYMGSMTPDAMMKWNALDEATKKQRQQAGMETWGKWVVQHQQSIVDGGAPLGKTKRVDASGIADTKNAVAAYTIVEAESFEAAAKMFLNHPHFSIFPGDSVEIIECLPMPQG